MGIILEKMKLTVWSPSQAIQLTQVAAAVGASLRPDLFWSPPLPQQVTELAFQTTAGQATIGRF